MAGLELARDVSSGPRRDISGILFLHHTPVLRWEVRHAGNVIENIAAFGRHTQFALWPYNVEFGFRPGLERVRFDAIVLHYSLFIPRPNWMLGEQFIEHLAAAQSYKVAFFQDEHHWCRMRAQFIDEVGVDCVFTMLEQPYARQVYEERTKASVSVPHLPSYVGPELLRAASRYSKPDHGRRIDIGYRGRPMPAYMGRGAQEKREIGERFAELAASSGLVLDIDVKEEDRIYGRDWHRFTADSRGTLGTESGASCFDLEDEVREQYERLSADGHEPTVEEMETGALGRWDGQIPYRTITPRNFEAAAFRVCQILYEGRYSGLMKPMRHYIPLKKDFSNLDEVIERYRDADLRRELTENAHADLIASGAYSYERLIKHLDAQLADAGLKPIHSRAQRRAARAALRRSAKERWDRYRTTRLSWLYGHNRRLWQWARYAFHPASALRVKVEKMLGRGR